MTFPKTNVPLFKNIMMQRMLPVYVGSIEEFGELIPACIRYIFTYTLN